jgi:uncharacterized protein
MSTALITGCSSGIGRELACAYARRGCDLVVIARREQLLNELARELSDAHGTRVLVVPADLSDPAAPQQIFDTVTSNGVEIDTLVNNAGVFRRGRFASVDWTALQQQQQLMATAPAHLIHLFLPGMLERNRGWIVNIASLAAIFPGSPKMALYGPAKTFLLSLTEGLAAEYADTNVKFTVMIAGMVATDLLDASGTLGPVRQKAPFLLSDVADLAIRTIDASLSGKVVAIDGTLNAVAIAMVRHLPLRFGYRAMNPNNPVMNWLGMGNHADHPPTETAAEPQTTPPTAARNRSAEASAPRNGLWSWRQ